MKYDEALKRWGAQQLSVSDWENVEIDEGTEGGCFGGHYEDSYCYCESARAVVEISWRASNWRTSRSSKSFKSVVIDLNLGEMIKEVLEIANGQA